MSLISKNKKSPQEILKRKIRRKIRNQGRFFKHSIIYLVLLSFFLVAATIIRAEQFVIPLLILFTLWMIGLIFHGLSAFVFNRINSWEETHYQQKLAELNLHKEKEMDDYNDMYEEEMSEPLDLKSYERLRKELDDKWGKGDFV